MANLPQPVFVSSAKRPGLAEQLLLSLAGSAPTFLRDYLQQRSLDNQAKLQGEADLAALGSMTQGPNVDPAITALLASLGASVTPNVVQAPTGGVPAPGAAPSFAPVTMGQNIDPSAIDPRLASRALDRVMQMQESALRRKTSEAQIRSADAATQATLGAERRATGREEAELAKLEAETGKAKAEASLMEKQAEHADALFQANLAQIRSVTAGNYEEAAASAEARRQAQVQFVEGGMRLWEERLAAFANSIEGPLPAVVKRRLASETLRIPVDPEQSRSYWEEQANNPDPRRAFELRQQEDFDLLGGEVQTAIREALGSEAAGGNPQVVLDKYMETNTGLTVAQSTLVKEYLEHLMPEYRGQLKIKVQGDTLKRIRDWFKALPKQPTPPLLPT